MTDTQPAGWWDLADLAGLGDIATEHGVRKSTVCNWTTRYPSFPAPLVELSTGAIYSRRQVRDWYTRRWPDRATPGQQKRAPCHRP